MAFFPYENYRFTTQLTPKEIEAKLKKLLYRPEYGGKVGANDFKIEKKNKNRYKNRLVTVIVIKGNVTKQFSSTEIHVMIRMTISTIVIFCFWVSVLLTIGMRLLVESIYTNDPLPLFLLPFGMATLGYLLITLGFKHESKKAKLLLSELLQEENLRLGSH